ncbi:MAG: hypothetical protein ABSG22_07715 [Sedimentisphaerales bacterium]
MKKMVLLIAVVLFGMVAPVLAEGDLHGDIGYTYDSMHVWRGFETWGHHSGSNPFIDLDLFGSGFGLSTEGHWANGTGPNHSPFGYEDGQRWDYTLFYQNRISAGDTYETDYKLSYVYYNYPDMSARHSEKCWDLQELNALLAWPNITGVKGLVPAYCIVKLWPSKSDTAVGGANPNGGTASGFAHIFMLNYALPIAGLTAETPNQVLNFHTELVWNDGIDPRPYHGYTSSDWTDFVMGVSTDFDLGNNFTFTPGLNYQITMEDSPTKGVSPNHDIVWATATAKYKF